MRVYSRKPVVLALLGALALPAVAEATVYYSVPATACVPIIINGANYYTTYTSDSYGVYAAPGASAGATYDLAMTCPIQPPNGVTIDSFRVRAYDNFASSNVVVSLYYQPLADNGTVSQLGSSYSTGSSGSVDDWLYTGGFSHTVTTASFTYFFIVTIHRESSQVPRFYSISIEDN